MSSDAVSLYRGGDAGSLARRVADRARASLNGDDAPEVTAAAEVAHEVAPWLPLPARGDTPALWEALASLGAVDLTVARVAEPHLDAHAILQEAHRQERIDQRTWAAYADAWSRSPLWQVYAAEGPERLHATEEPGEPDRWCLNGVKPWCSLAESASHALITAWVDDERRGLFAVDLRDPGVASAGSGGVSGQSGTWAARGLVEVRSTGLRLDDVPAVAVGPPQWYLTRPGFAWGGAGVAAIWYGATVAIARRIRDAAVRREPDQVALVHLGAIDAALARARAVLLDAADVADDPATAADESVHAAARVRQVVADTAEEVLTRSGHALGPAPLTGDESHARRVADLTVYLRQHHAERDQAALGRLVLGEHHGWRWW